MKYLPILATVTKVSGQTEHQHQKIDKPGEVQFVDQVYYPIQLLDQMQEDGVDITGKFVDFEFVLIFQRRNLSFFLRG